MQVRTRRTTRLLAGAALVTSSLALVAVGAFAASSNSTYIDLGAHGSYATDHYGLATNSTNWRTTLFGWAGAVRLKVVSQDGKPIFVGVAPSAAIGRYLAGAGYTTIGDDDARTDHAGGAPELPPATAVQWTAHAQGAGTQTLRWNATSGRQIAFAMNADGSRPVRVRIESSAVTLGRMPWWVPTGLLLLGVVLLGVSCSRIRPRER
jgi:hypothetical protein